MARTSLTFVTFLGAAVLVPAAGAAATTVPEAAGDNPFGYLGLPELAITITEDAFEGVPAELAAGRYVLAVTNTLDEEVATETSGFAFLRAPEGTTATEVVELIAAAALEEEAEYPDWYYETVIAGGPYVFPGATGYALVDLTAGEWILWGEDPTAAQPPVPVIVTGEPPADQPAPTADATIEMSEFAFTFDPPLAAGPQVIEVTNAGEQPHFIYMAKVPEGTTVDEVFATFFGEPGSSVPPSASSAPGGLSFEDVTEALSTGDQSAGTTVWLAVDFAPGTYLAACFITDPETGMPHAMIGMIQVLVIE